jgi:hypothetical protein
MVYSNIHLQLKISKIEKATLSIYDLTTKIVTSTHCSISPSLCAISSSCMPHDSSPVPSQADSIVLLILWQKVHTEDSSSKIWDAVDLRLGMICTSAIISTSQMTDPQRESQGLCHSEPFPKATVLINHTGLFLPYLMQIIDYTALCIPTPLLMVTPMFGSYQWTLLLMGIIGWLRILQ